MKIVFITDSLTSGGAERVISILASALSSKKYSVEIICLRGHELFYKIDNRVKILYADDYSEYWLLKLLWMRRYISESYIIIAFMTKVYIFTLISLFLKKTKIICSERNDPRFTAIPWKVLRRILLPKASALVVQTDSIKSFFSYGIQKKTFVIYNPIDQSQICSTSWNPASHKILAVGRTDKQKNYPMMIKAFNRIHQIFPEYYLDIWSGRGEQETEIQNLIQQYNAAGYIHMRGRSNDISKEYIGTYMFIMSSNYEGFSNSLMEVLCSGLPVISTNVSGAADVIISGYNGFLSPVGDEDAFYAAMKKLIEDKSLAFTLSSNACKCHDLFDVDSICKQWVSLIDSFTIVH